MILDCRFANVCCRFDATASLYCLQTLSCLSSFQLPLSAATSNLSCLYFKLDVPVQRPLAEPLHSFEYSDAGCKCEFFVDGGSYFFCMTNVIDETHICLRYDGANTVECSTLIDHSFSRFAIWFAVSMFLVNHNASFIHASAVVCEQGAVLCLGESGTGKSTHTQLWLRNVPNTFLLNDDSPIISALGSSPLACGSPWSGKTPCYRPEQVPILAFVRLRQAPYNKMTRLSVAQSFAAIYPSLPPSLAFAEHFASLFASIISRCLLSTPCFLLECRPDADAAILCHDTILPQ